MGQTSKQQNICIWLTGLFKSIHYVGISSINFITFKKRMQKQIWSCNGFFGLILCMFFLRGINASFQYSCSQSRLLENCSQDSSGNNCDSGCCLTYTLTVASLTQVVSACCSCLARFPMTTFTRYGKDSLGNNCDCVLTDQTPSYTLSGVTMSAMIFKACANYCCSFDDFGDSDSSSRPNSSSSLNGSSSQSSQSKLSSSSRQSSSSSSSSPNDLSSSNNLGGADISSEHKDNNLGALNGYIIEGILGLLIIIIVIIYCCYKKIHASQTNSRQYEGHSLNTFKGPSLNTIK